MDKIILIAEKIGKILHFFTGFIVHPDKGGCCLKNDNNLKKDE